MASVRDAQHFRRTIGSISDHSPDPVPVNIVHRLCQIVRLADPKLKIRMLEIGAQPIPGKRERFLNLIDWLPGSEVIAFELDATQCDELNSKKPKGITYFAQALGIKEERRPLYHTKHSICTSLFRPNDEYINLFSRLDSARLKTISEVDTVSLDHFLSSNKLPPIDFMKVDIQGAERDVFLGGQSALQRVLMIVSEVEFIPLYEQQPLFGDICRCLDESGIMFHKFLTMAGRALKPVIINGDSRTRSQHLWADSVFVKNLARLDRLTPTQLLKMAVLSTLYDSPDVAYACLTRHPDDSHLNLAGQFVEASGNLEIKAE